MVKDDMTWEAMNGHGGRAMLKVAGRASPNVGGGRGGPVGEKRVERR